MTTICIGLYVKSSADLHETLILLTTFEKYSNIKFHENLSCRHRVVPNWRRDGQTDRHDEAERI